MTATSPWTPERVRKLRDALQMTQREFARRIGVQLRAVQRWEAGDRSPRGAAGTLLDAIETDLRERQKGRAR